MKRFCLLLLCLFVLAAPARAGTVVGIIQSHGTTLNIGTGAPTAGNACLIGDHWWRTDATPVDYTCTATNTWTLTVSATVGSRGTCTPVAYSFGNNGLIGTTEIGCTGTANELGFVTDNAFGVYSNTNGTTVPLMAMDLSGNTMFAGKLGTAYSTTNYLDLNVNSGAAFINAAGTIPFWVQSNGSTIMSLSPTGVLVPNGGISDQAGNCSGNLACRHAMNNGTYTWTFGQAWGHTPACQATEESNARALMVAPTTTAVVVTSSTTTANSDTVDILCVGQSS